MSKPWVELEPDIARLAVEAARARLEYAVAVETTTSEDERRWRAFERLQAAEYDLSRAIERAAGRPAPQPAERLR